MIPGGIINYCIRFIASLIFGPPIFVLLPEHANETRHLPIWKEVKFVDRDPHWYTRRVKEAIHIILHNNNNNNNKPLFNHDLFKSKYMLEGSCVRVTNYLPKKN